MRRRDHRRVAAVASLAASVLGLLAGCGDSGTVRATTLFGQKVGSTVVLVDVSAASALRCTVAAYVAAQAGSGVRMGVGAADQIANTVKDGQQADVVVLPAGPALDRLRDELVTPPVRIAARTPQTLWVGVVTDRGLRLTRFLTRRGGRAAVPPAACPAQP